MRMFDDFKNWYQSEAGQKAVTAKGLSAAGAAEVCARWCAEYADKRIYGPMSETIRQLTAKAEAVQEKPQSDEVLERATTTLLEARRQRDEAQKEVTALQQKLLVLEQQNAKQAAEILELSRGNKGGSGGKSPSSNWTKKR